VTRSLVAITFLEPGLLWLLAAVAVLGVVYVVLQLRHQRYEVRFTNLELLDVVAPKRPGWRRHLAAAAFVLGLGALVVALARPLVEVEVPRERATVILAIDVSLSMMATDVQPSRLEAAQEAAREFVEELPETINVGLVAFDGIARVAVPPTLDRQAAQRAVDALELGPGTAIGEAIFASLDALELARVAENGEDVPGHIVVMSDGATTVGRPNAAGAAAASEAGIPVSTISFGTPFGEILHPDEPVMVPVPVEPGPLRSIASDTGGSFFEAETLAGLTAVYEDIGSSIGFTTEEQEVTHRAVWAALGLLLAASVMSLVWFSRLP
jgi:Ca-activated chloride channel homolog